MRHRIVTWEFLLVLSLLSLGIMHALDVRAIEQVYRWVLLAGLLYLFHLVSPTSVIFGSRSVPFDLFMAFSFLLLAGGRAFQFLSGVGEGTVVVLGAALLVATCWMATRDLPEAKRSALGAFNVKGAKRAPVGFLLALSFFIMVFQPLVWVTLSLGEVPWLRPLASLALLAGLLHERGVVRFPYVERMWGAAGTLAREFALLFMSRRTFLLGVTGLLVLQFALQVGATLVPAALGALARLEGMRSAAGTVSLLGTVALFALPVYVWWKTMLVRKNHEHLPNWPAWLIGLVSGCMASSLLFPLVEILPAGPGAALFSSVSGNALLALSASAVIFAIALGVGLLDDYLRRVLMMGPFLAAALFLGLYAYQAFVGTFLLAMGQALAFLNGAAALVLPVLVLLSGLRIVFLVAGYLSFLYEAWRD